MPLWYMFVRLSKKKKIKANDTRLGCYKNTLEFILLLGYFKKLAK